MYDSDERDLFMSGRERMMVVRGGGGNDMGRWYNGVRREVDGEKECVCMCIGKSGVGMNGSV